MLLLLPRPATSKTRSGHAHTSPPSRPCNVAKRNSKPPASKRATRPHAPTTHRASTKTPSPCAAPMQSEQPPCGSATGALETQSATQRSKKRSAHDPRTLAPPTQRMHYNGSLDATMTTTDIRPADSTRCGAHNRLATCLATSTSLNPPRGLTARRRRPAYFRASRCEVPRA